MAHETLTVTERLFLTAPELMTVLSAGRAALHDNLYHFHRLAPHGGHRLVASSLYVAGLIPFLEANPATPKTLTPRLREYAHTYAATASIPITQARFAGRVSMLSDSLGGVAPLTTTERILELPGGTLDRWIREERIAADRSQSGARILVDIAEVASWCTLELPLELLKPTRVQAPAHFSLDPDISAPGSRAAQDRPNDLYTVQI